MTLEMARRKASANPASALVDKDEVMTVATVAQYLHCPQGTIYRLLARQLIPAFKLGSDWRFNKRVIERWARQSMARSAIIQFSPRNAPRWGSRTYYGHS
jgi:excisionase family DNA binding protein